MNEIAFVPLLDPHGVTAGGHTGSWVDLQGYDMERGVTAVLRASAGTTPGTCGGYIQAASTTAGTDATTLGTFSTLTSAGGGDTKAIYTVKRYARVMATAQTGKDMLLAVGLLIRPRFRP